MVASLVAQRSMLRAVGIGAWAKASRHDAQREDGEADHAISSRDSPDAPLLGPSPARAEPEAVSGRSLDKSRSAAAQHFRALSRRWATTKSISEVDSLAILNGQREKRPNSPHLTIYQPQVGAVA